MTETQLLPAAELYVAALPSDQSGLFESLTEAVITTLQPGTAYEAYLAGQISELDVEIYRHRQMRNGLLRSQFQDEVIFKLSRFRPATHSYSETIEFRARRDPKVKRAWKLARQLCSDDPAIRDDAKHALAKQGHDLNHLTALAYQNAAGIADHEDRIAQLEVRRRRLLRDFREIVDARSVAAEAVN